jgi:hypothetical protein
VYKWGTNSIGGRLDAGTYTVWVVNGPNDLSHLNSVDYSMIEVNLVLTPVSPFSEKQAAGLVPATLLAGVTAVLLAAVYRSRYH